MWHNNLLYPHLLCHLHSMNDDSVQLDTYAEVYDANDYPEQETRPVELFSPCHKLVLGMSGHSESSSPSSLEGKRPAY